MIFTKTFFEIRSDLGEDWSVKNIETDIKTKKVYIDLEYCSQEYYDPETGGKASLYDHTEQRIWRHLDIWEYQSYIRCRIPRVLNESGKVKVISTGWSGKYSRHTYSFEIKVIDTLKATKNQTKTAELLGCSFRLVNRIIHESTERGLKRRDIKSIPLMDISIDEKSFKKGHKYVTVLTHPMSGCVIDVGENRDTESVESLIQSTFTTEQLAKINTVGMDMWKPYIKAIKKHIPSAEIVHDHFDTVRILHIFH